MAVLNEGTCAFYLSLSLSPFVSLYLSLSLSLPVPLLSMAKEALFQFCTQASEHYDVSELRGLAEQASEEQREDAEFQRSLSTFLYFNHNIFDFERNPTVEELKAFVRSQTHTVSSVPDFVGILFCPECSNMLYPEPSQDDGRLYYICRSCKDNPHREPAQSNFVSVTRADRDIQALTHVIEDVVADPTLPHTEGNLDKPCPSCRHRDAVYFQTPFNRERSNMKLFYVCCSCKHKWAD